VQGAVGECIPDELHLGGISRVVWGVSVSRLAESESQQWSGRIVMSIDGFAGGFTGLPRTAGELAKISALPNELLRGR
jgi:hypothetical protein